MKTFAAASIFAAMLASASALAQVAPTPGQAKPDEPAAATKKPDVLTRAPGTVEAGAAAEKPMHKKKTHKPKSSTDGSETAKTPPANP